MRYEAIFHDLLLNVQQNMDHLFQALSLLIQIFLAGTIFVETKEM